jgi:hypothetical protein
MGSWLKAVAGGIGLALAPYRGGRTWPGRVATALAAALILSPVAALAALSITGVGLTVNGRELPLDPAHAGLAATGFVALLFLISTIRQRKRLDQLGSPLRTWTAQNIRLGSELLPVVASCKTSMELERVKQGINGWNSSVYTGLRRSRTDWAARFTSAYATRSHLSLAPESPLSDAPYVWADLQAQLDVLQEIFREGAALKTAA